MKEKWYVFVIANKNYWTHGMTLKRLDKVKAAVFADEDIMWDLLQRHGGKDKTPEEMKANDKECFEHCIGNFVCNIAYKMAESGIVKRQ